MEQKIEKPLSSLLTDLCISPAIATTILDTDVGDTWLSVIPEFEHRLSTIKERKRVKAARDLAEVVEGLRIVVCRLCLVYNILTFLAGCNEDTTILSRNITAYSC